MTAILFVSLLVCFVLGMPIAFSLGVASVTTLQYGSNLPLTLAAQRPFPLPGKGDRGDALFPFISSSL